MQAHRRASWGRLGREARDKLSNDNDIKIIIQGKNSQTGVGKTTLAIELCRYIDRHGWSAEEKSYIEPQSYLNDFLDQPPGSALLLDEIGAGADSRRATSTENVDLSQGWQMLRARNIATVCTLPSTNMLDPRMLELADYWILVKKRGLAQPYEIRVNDFNGSVARKPLPGEEHIKFPDIPDGDEDKEYLDSIKDGKVRSGGLESIKLDEHEERVEKAREKAADERRDELIKDFYGASELTYDAIGRMESIDLSKERVGQIIRGDS